MDVNERDQWREADRLFQSLLDLDEAARLRAIKRAAPNPQVRDKLDALLRSEHGTHRLLDNDPGDVIWKPANASEKAGDASEFTGRRIGDWELIELLGRGGMASVYRARRADEDYDHYAAIKLLGIALHSPAEEARFRRERQILAQLQHPNIASLIDAGLDVGGTPYLAMRLIEGERIDRFCQRRKLSIRQRIELMLQVCAAAAYAHRQLVVHRDIKPGNILVDEHGHATLLDFGIARLLDNEDTGEATMTQAFTPDYAAPEQRIVGRALGTAVDVYGIGAVLYRLLTGGPPVHDSHGEPVLASTVAKLNGTASSAAALRGDLDSVVSQALATDPQRRYGSVDALAGDLRAWLQHRPLLARRANTWMRIEKFVRRNRAASILAALVVLVGAAGLTSFILSNHALQRRADELQALTQFQTDMLQQVVPRNVGEHLHNALTNAIRQTSPDQVDSLEPAVAKIDFTGLAIDMLDEAILHPSVASAQKDFPDQPRVHGQLLQQLAIDYRDVGRLEQAHKIQDEATKLLHDAFGDDDRLTLSSMREQLKLVRDLNLPDGEARHRKVLQLHIRYLGDDDLDTERARGALAQWLMNHGKAREAESLLSRAAIRISQLKGDENPDAVATRANLAYAISTQGDYARSIPVYRHALTRSTRVFGKDAPYTLTIRNNLAYVLNHTGHSDEAETFYRDVYEGRRRTLGDKNRATMISLNNYAVSLREHGKAAQAAPLQRDAYRGMRATLGPNHSNTLHLGMNLARDYLALDKYDKALTLLESIAPALKKHKDQRALTQTQRLLGRSLQGLNRFDAAQRAYTGSWDLATATKNEPEQRKAASALVQLYSGSNQDPQRLALWQKRLRQVGGDPAKQER